ncbi:MAG TPA: hypothetical protein VFE03_02670 [Caulobacteraceae bacterium]|nr:hypothetical protein [Caulobacteraceae bacterium]
MKKLIVALAAVALIGGCVKTGKNGEQEVNVLGAKVETGTSLPADAPPYVKAYPGAGEIVKMKIAGMSAVAFEAPASVDEVIAYYRTQAAADGLPELPEQKPPSGAANQKGVTFGDPGGERMLMVLARPGKQGTMVSLTYKPAATAPQ